MTLDAHGPIRPAHPGIGNRHSPEYLQGFDDGRGAALDAVSDWPGFVGCTCEVCIARTNAFCLLVGQIYARFPHMTVEELRDRNKRLILRMANRRKEGEY